MQFQPVQLPLYNFSYIPDILAMESSTFFPTKPAMWAPSEWPMMCTALFFCFLHIAQTICKTDGMMAVLIACYVKCFHKIKHPYKGQKF